MSSAGWSSVRAAVERGLSSHWPNQTILKILDELAATEHERDQAIKQRDAIIVQRDAIIARVVDAERERQKEGSTG